MVAMRDCDKREDPLKMGIQVSDRFFFYVIAFSNNVITECHPSLLTLKTQTRESKYLFLYQPQGAKNRQTRGRRLVNQFDTNTQLVLNY